MPNRSSDQLTIVVQAGGESHRMGQDKALAPFLGQPLIQRVVQRLASIGAEVVVTTNHPESLEFLGLRLVGDLWPERSNLGGLYTALIAARSPLVAVVACDMPFASPELLAAEAEMLEANPCDVVIPQGARGFEPLHAVYRREACLPAVRAALIAQKLRMDSWFPAVRVKALRPEVLRAYDPQGITFLNINTPDDLRRAEGLAREG